MLHRKAATGQKESGDFVAARGSVMSLTFSPCAALATPQHDGPADPAGEGAGSTKPGAPPP